MLSNFNIGDKLSITQIKEKLKYIYIPLLIILQCLKRQILKIILQ